ncbi:MAG: hypothetical protein HOP37_02690, partial [Cyclobacteriaceae bacterium]|nr:hypothetical protein [Cyclobacteriaceae bacterium]
MKTKIAFLFLMCTGVLSTAVAQSREDDDMYFTSKDRAILNAAAQKDRQEIFASSNVRRITESETAATINPTDSYSARNVNPEYISGSKVGTSTTATAPYFSPNYQPTTVNQNLASNCASCGFNNFNNGFYSPFNRFGNPYRMGMMGMGMGMSPWGYNSMSMMNPWMDPWMMNGMNGFYQPGLSFSFGMGSGWGNGWNSFNNPWGYNNWGMNSFYGGWGNSWGMNSFYNNGWNNWGNPWGGANTVVIVDRPRPNSARGEEIDRYYSTNGNRGGSNSGGRVATSDNSQQYYNRAWRNDASTPQRGSTTWNNT